MRRNHYLAVRYTWHSVVFLQQYEKIRTNHVDKLDADNINGSPCLGIGCSSSCAVQFLRHVLRHRIQSTVNDGSSA